MGVLFLFLTLGAWGKTLEPLWGEYQSPRGLAEAQIAAEEIAAKAKQNPETGLVFLIQGNYVPKEIRRVLERMTLEGIPYHVMLEDTQKEADAIKDRWMGLVRLEGTLFLRLRKDPALASLSQRQMEAWARELWSATAHNLGHFFGLQQGWYCLAAKYYTDEKTGFRRPFWEQAGEMLLASKLVALTTFAVWFTLQQKVASDPSLAPYQGALAAGILQVLWSYFNRANNLLYVMGIGYRNDLTQSVPKLRWTAFAMTLQSVVNSMLVQGAATGWNALLSPHAWENSLQNGVLGVFAKVLPTQWLASLERPKDGKGQLKSIVANLFFNLGYQFLKWSDLFRLKWGNLFADFFLSDYAFKGLAVFGIGYLVLQHYLYQKPHAEPRPWWQQLCRRVWKDLQAVGTALGFGQKPFFHSVEVYQIPRSSCVWQLLEKG